MLISSSKIFLIGGTWPRPARTPCCRVPIWRLSRGFPTTGIRRSRCGTPRPCEWNCTSNVAYRVVGQCSKRAATCETTSASTRGSGPLFAPNARSASRRVATWAVTLRTFTKCLSIASSTTQCKRLRSSQLSTKRPSSPWLVQSLPIMKALRMKSHLCTWPTRNSTDSTQLLKWRTRITVSTRLQKVQLLSYQLL